MVICEWVIRVAIIDEVFFYFVYHMKRKKDYIRLWSISTHYFVSNASANCH